MAGPDAGMWEARDQQRHVSFEVLCWVALDRAIALADRLGHAADPAGWGSARNAARAAVLERAWSPGAGASAGAFASDDLDASVLLLPLVGFLPADDVRMCATIDAIERELGTGGLVRRWPDDESGFLICTFWLSECLALAGEPERARAWFAGALGYAHDLGLLSEEGVPGGGELPGNFPQAFSHVGLINAAWRITEARNALTRTLALELAPLKINVNSLAPGMVLTPFNQPAIDDPALLEEQVQSIPLKRAAQPEEIARLAMFLAAAESDYCTGSSSPWTEASP